MIASRKITVTIPDAWWAQSLLWLAFAALGFTIGILTASPGLGAFFVWIAIVAVIVNTGIHIGRRSKS